MKAILIKVLFILALASLMSPTYARWRCTSFNQYNGQAWWGEAHSRAKAAARAQQACAYNSWGARRCVVNRCVPYDRWDRGYGYRDGFSIQFGGPRW